MKKYLALFLLPIALSSCDSGNTPEEQTTVGSDTIPADRTETNIRDYHIVKDSTVENGGIRVTPLEDSPEFADGILQVNAPDNNASIQGNEVKFNYEIKNFRLGHQTDRKVCPQCSNSEKGQHVHLILNNLPYLAKYQPNFTETLEPGHYVALSFLSRSYHESVKHREAYDLRQFTVGGANNEEVDLTQPFLFYSRPKGEYVGADTAKILLDFYLVNTDLSETGNKVRATINGNEFTFIKWRPYLIQGLPMGETTIKLELLDANGNLVDTKYNPVERTITLKEAAGA